MRNIFTKVNPDKSILALCLLCTPMLAIDVAHAMTDSEYVNEVAKNLNQNWDMPGGVFGKVKAEVRITKEGAIILKSSGNKVFDAEVLRASNAVLDSTIVPGLTFPVEFSRGRAADGDKRPSDWY